MSERKLTEEQAEALTAERIPGAYWVRDGAEWFPAIWRNDEWGAWWDVPGDERQFTDSDFDEIDERRIERAP